MGALHPVGIHPEAYSAAPTSIGGRRSSGKRLTGLYHNPPERAVVLCVDEKTQVQALDRSPAGAAQPAAPQVPVAASFRPGRPPWPGAAVVWGWLILLPAPESCRFCERAGRVKERVAAPQASLTRWPGSRSCRAAGQGDPDGGGRVSGSGSAAFLCGVISRGGGRGAGAVSSQPYLGPRGTVAAPAT